MIASQLVINNWNEFVESCGIIFKYKYFQKTDLTHTGNITQLDTTGKLVTTSILVLPILIINCEIRSHSGSGKRWNMPAPRIYHKVPLQNLPHQSYLSSNPYLYQSIYIHQTLQYVLLIKEVCFLIILSKTSLYRSQKLDGNYLRQFYRQIM